MSGYTDSAIADQGVLETGTYLLQKPFTEEALIQKVREVLDADAPGKSASEARRRSWPEAMQGRRDRREMPHVRRLLIVDDDEAIRRLFRLNLAEDYEIIDTDDPEQALALAMEHKPDAILLDMHMPKFSGFDLCRTIQFLQSDATRSHICRKRGVGRAKEGGLHGSRRGGIFREADRFRRSQGAPAPR